MKDRAVTCPISMPNTLLDRLDKYCKRVMRPRSWVVRRQIEEFLKEQEDEQENYQPDPA